MPIQAGNMAAAKRERVRVAEIYYGADPALEESDLSIKNCGTMPVYEMAKSILERQADLQVLRKTNLHIVIMMAQAMDSYDRLYRFVTGLLTAMVRTGKDPEPAIKMLRPFLDQMEKDRRFVMRTSREFGFTPRSRAEMMNLMVPVINSHMINTNMAPRKVGEGEHEFYQ